MPTAPAPPARFVAGDSIDFLWSHADHPASAGWATSWRLVGPGVALALTAAPQGDAFRVTATAAATAALTVPAAGVPATLMGTAARGAERFEVYRAPAQLLANPATVTGDLRGHAARTLAAIEALLEGRATKDQMSYRIGDRELSRIPVPELIELREYYRREARLEADAARLASGLPRSPRRVMTRMARA